jgi:hypothetical protein
MDGFRRAVSGDPTRGPKIDTQVVDPEERGIR